MAELHAAQEPRSSPTFVASEPQSAKERLTIEYQDLKAKCDKLDAFMRSAEYGTVSEVEKTYLEAQHDLMTQLCGILHHRIGIA